MEAVLSHELEAFERALPVLLRSREGQYAVICGDKIEHFEASYEKALDWAYDRHGLKPFMVRQVLAEQPMIYITRHLAA